MDNIYLKEKNSLHSFFLALEENLQIEKWHLSKVSKIERELKDFQFFLQKVKSFERTIH